MPKTVAIVGTLDTKGEEFRFLRDAIRDAGLATLVIDVGVLDPPHFPPDIARAEVAQAAGASLDGLLAEKDRGKSIEVMVRGAAAVVRRLHVE